ncbi:MAG TPA: amidohydrolase family protein, partial [Vicinamibacterales bacterium]
MLNDAHAHFFSPRFFDTLSQQRGGGESAGALCRELGWDDPVSPDLLADRWVQELDTRGVSRSALIASVPGDEQSVAQAVARHPSRFVGFFMVNAGAADAVARTRSALGEGGLRTVCLFPAMHHVPLDDART